MHFFHKPRRHIRRCHHTKPLNLYHHTLLPPHSCHFPYNPSEISFHYTYQVSALVPALFRADQSDVFVVHAGGTDEVHHLLVRDGEGRILALGIRLEMVVIIRKVGEGGGVLDVGLDFFGGGIDKQDVRDEWFEHPLSFCHRFPSVRDVGESRFPCLHGSGICGL